MPHDSDAHVALPSPLSQKATAWLGVSLFPGCLSGGDDVNFTNLHPWLRQGAPPCLHDLGQRDQLPLGGLWILEFHQHESVYQAGADWERSLACRGEMNPGEMKPVSIGAPPHIHKATPYNAR